MAQKVPCWSNMETSKFVSSQYLKTVLEKALSKLKVEGEDFVIVPDEVSDSEKDLGCADELMNEPAEGLPTPKKRHGLYWTYSLQFKISIIIELIHTPVEELSDKYNIPRSTIFSWEK